MGDEASRSKKKKMKLEVSKARRKSKREESLSESSSSDPSESSSRYSYGHRKKTKSKKKSGRGRGRNRNVNTDHSDQQRSLGKDKRQDRHRHQRREGIEKKRRKRKRKRSPSPIERREALENKMKRKRSPSPKERREGLEKKTKRKRSPSPIERNKRRRYRSVSTCSDSSRSTSSSYLSDTCSTCSSTYNSNGDGKVKKKRSDSSKRSYGRCGLTKRNDHKEPQNKKTTKSYKNLRDAHDTESPNWKANGHRDGSDSLVYCLDNDMPRKKKRDHAVGRDNLLVDGQEDSCDDGKRSSEPLSSVVKCENEGQKSVDAASDTVALELLLRKKALENLIKFRRFGSNTIKTPLSNETERPLFVDSREFDGSGGLCGIVEFRRDEQNVTENLPDEHHRDGRRDANRQLGKDSNILAHDTFETNGACSNKHKWIEIGEKESQIESIKMNKEHTCKSEMAKVEEPAIETSQECGLRTDIVSNRLTCEVLETCTSKNEKSQTHMLQVDKELQIEMPPLDVISMPLKNKSSKDDKATTESLEIDASQIGVLNLDDTNPPKLEASSFQQKTMAVRQGGETVQVNYKVYIPQRSAALARRHLKR